MHLSDRLGTAARDADAWLHAYAIPLVGSLMITGGVALWLLN